jgi:hypothetical protein
LVSSVYVSSRHVCSRLRYVYITCVTATPNLLYSLCVATLDGRFSSVVSGGIPRLSCAKYCALFRGHDTWRRFSYAVSVGFPRPIHAECDILLRHRDARFSNFLSSGIPWIACVKYVVFWCVAALGVGFSAPCPAASQGSSSLNMAFQAKFNKFNKKLPNSLSGCHLQTK